MTLKKGLLISLIAVFVSNASCSFASNKNDIHMQENKARLKEIKEIANEGPYQPNWDSLAKYNTPEWYKNAKFGIFIHWGIYSVPAYNDAWYPRWMYDPKEKDGDFYQHHKKTYGAVDKFGYKDFIPMFKAEKFDPVGWAKLFKEAGAKYVVPVAEHHDGFPMYDTKYSDWNAAKMGPTRDVIGELSSAIRDQGMYFGVSSHRAENWWFYGQGRKIKSDVTDEKFRGLYGPAMDKEESDKGVTPPNQAFRDDWLLRTTELVDKYHPDLVWFDWWVVMPYYHKELQDFGAYYYNKGSKRDHMVAINYKAQAGKSFPDTAAVLDIERGKLSEIRPLFWQSETSLSTNSWSYNANSIYRTADSLVDDLIDIVSKNGSLLLNVGPRPDGTIPEPEVRLLKDIGKWLSVNGESIYGTRPWVKFGEGPTPVIDGTMANDSEKDQKTFTKQDIRFTQKDRTLYAILLAWPGDKAKITIASIAPNILGRPIKGVSLLGSTEKIFWTLGEQGLTITLPSGAPSEFAQVIKIEQ